MFPICRYYYQNNSRESGTIWRKLDRHVLRVSCLFFCSANLRWGYRYTADWRVQTSGEPHEVKDHSLKHLESQEKETQQFLGPLIDSFPVKNTCCCCCCCCICLRICRLWIWIESSTRRQIQFAYYSDVLCIKDIVQALVTREYPLWQLGFFYQGIVYEDFFFFQGGIC